MEETGQNPGEMVALILCHFTNLSNQNSDLHKQFEMLN